VRFLADMGISPKTIARLRTLGHDAVHLSEHHLERLHDPEIVAKARQERRVLLVHDLGVGELLAASGATLPSVITFRLRNMHPERVNSALQEILSQHADALERDSQCHRRTGTCASSAARRLTRREFEQIPALHSGCVSGLGPERYSLMGHAEQRHAGGG
jgi:predicted nuclease of predicted toxin-antitoxin system